METSQAGVPALPAIPRRERYGTLGGSALVLLFVFLYVGFWLIWDSHASGKGGGAARYHDHGAGERLLRPGQRLVPRAGGDQPGAALDPYEWAEYVHRLDSDVDGLPGRADLQGEEAPPGRR
ncbi:protein of unknown function [Streptomyces sp. KY75]|nr:protein of unknown function [Streptomyces sp. KY75]CAD5994730.1 protein of unknown function [Streptomyces sp. KY70]